MHYTRRYTRQPAPFRVAVLAAAAIFAVLCGAAALARDSKGAPSAGGGLWSFQTVTLPSVPHSTFDSLSANPVDRFVFAALERKGLSPSPLADRRTLLRRVTIDLTGLPPTPAEMASFLDDRWPDAYERVVDRLLASSAYGERWGRHWLDVVRYGELNGYEQNHVRSNAWPYRDYVIDAFNSDLPYPQFIAEQLAGDVLAAKRPAAAAATGFLVAGTHDTVGIQTEEGTRQQRSNDIDDIVSTTGASFLALTVGCAKCHDHKFDPIPQRDFYRLAACFAGVHHGERAVRDQTADEAKVQAELTTRAAMMQNSVNEIDSAARAILTARSGANEQRPAVNARRNEDKFAPIAARFVRFTILATADGAEPCIDELQVFASGSTSNLALASNGAKASASSLLPGFAIHAIDNLNDGRLGNEHSWISAEAGQGWAQIELPKSAIIDRVVWSRDGAEIPRFDDRLSKRYRIDISSDGRVWRTVSTDAGRAGSMDYIHPNELMKVMTDAQRARRAELIRGRDEANRRLESLRGAQLAYIGQFGAPDPTFVLRRGDVMQRLEVVQPGALSKLAAAPDSFDAAGNGAEPERRLALANWIADPKNPLTARVFVNRAWQHHFGRGIVGTPSDFGRNGEPPTHPELLDWLAAKFMAPTAATAGTTASPGFGWRLKPLHRLLVESYTYRQSSAQRPKCVAKDASNTLLWRMNLQRAEAEVVRDSILAASGKLDRTMGGPGYKLYKYNVVNVAIFEPLEDFGPSTWRRGVYQQAARGIRDDLLGAFDCPESSQRAPRRESTTTALQALSLLNGPFVAQQAGYFAQRIKSEANGLDAQIDRAFQIALGRMPDAAEHTDARTLVTRDGLAELCRALLNSNEFLYY